MVIFSISVRFLGYFSFLTVNPPFRAIIAVRIHFKEKKMVSTKTTIAGFEFDNCLMNAAGVACMTIAELEEVKNSAAGTFVTKTATLEYRQGNPEPRYQDVPLGSINSMGLPNQGLDYYLDYLLELQTSEPNRTFFLSLVGMSPEETHTILKKVEDSDFRGLTELNLSCPNVPGKPQIDRKSVV